MRFHWPILGRSTVYLFPRNVVVPGFVLGMYTRHWFSEEYVGLEISFREINAKFRESNAAGCSGGSFKLWSCACFLVCRTRLYSRRRKLIKSGNKWSEKYPQCRLFYLVILGTPFDRYKNGHTVLASGMYVCTHEYRLMVETPYQLIMQITVSNYKPTPYHHSHDSFHVRSLDCIKKKKRKTMRNWCACSASELFLCRGDQIWDKLICLTSSTSQCVYRCDIIVRGNHRSGVSRARRWFGVRGTPNKVIQNVKKCRTVISRSLRK